MAEEQPSSILTTLSSTTISGYVNVSSYWDVAPPPARFENVCIALRDRGFQVKRYGNHYLFLRSGKTELYLYKRGPFVRPSDLQQLRRLLRSAL